MTKKILVIETCVECPFFDADPNYVDTPPEQWGIPSCCHPAVGLCPVHNWQGEVPQWCPLPDAS